MLQRAIIAIDGPGEGGPTPDEFGQATRNCLWNLQHRKKNATVAAGTARGNVAGPAEVPATGPLPGIPQTSSFFSGADNVLYVLGHGDPGLTTIAGQTPAALATAIREWLDPGLIATGAEFTGDIKLVSCFSAEEAAWSSSLTSQSATPVQSMAQRMAIALTPPTASSFKPRSVQGITGVGWVSETSGKIMSIALPAYLSARSSWTTDPFQAAPGTATEAAAAAARGSRLGTLFGQPAQSGHASVTSGTSGTTSASGTTSTTSTPPAVTVGKGPKAKRRFLVGTGAEELPTPRSTTATSTATATTVTTTASGTPAHPFPAATTTTSTTVAHIPPASTTSQSTSTPPPPVLTPTGSPVLVHKGGPGP